MNYLWLVIALLVLAGAGWLIWRFGTQVVIKEKDGELVTVRRLKLTPALTIGVLAGLLLAFLLSTVRAIPPGRAMVKFNVITREYEVSGEGVAFVPPLLYNVSVYDLRRQEYTLTSQKGRKRPNVDETLWTPSKDGLQVGVDLTVWYRLNPDMLTQIHQRIGPDYAEKVVRPAVRSVARHVIAQYSVDEVYSGKRKKIEDEIFAWLKGLLEKDGFIIEGVVLRDIHLPADYSKALEEKQIAQQEAERMKFVLQKEQQEAERKRIEAEGTARAIEIVSKALKRNPEYITYLYVDKLSDKVQVIVSDQGTILNLGELRKGK